MEIRVNSHQRHITILTIAHEARRNAMTRAMMADLAELWDRLDPDPDCRAVILTGAGERSFCVGADISGDLGAGPEMARVINRALLKDTPFSKPVVAAVNGDCAGGGVELLLSTDIRAAVPGARFGLPEVQVVDLSVRGRDREAGATDRPCPRDGPAVDRATRRRRLRRRRSASSTASSSRTG